MTFENSGFDETLDLACSVKVPSVFSGPSMSCHQCLWCFHLLLSPVHWKISVVSPEIKVAQVLRERVKERWKWKKKWIPIRNNTTTTTTKLESVTFLLPNQSPDLILQSLLTQMIDWTTLCNHYFDWFKWKNTISNTLCIAVTSHWEGHVTSHEEKLIVTLN